MAENVIYDYDWQKGDTAVAWLSKKTYAKVKVVKDNRDSLHGNKDYYLPVTIKQSDSEDDDEFDYECNEDGQCSDSENESFKSLFTSDGKLDLKFLDAKVERNATSSGLCYYIQTDTRERFWVPLSAMRPAERCHMHVLMMLPNKVSFNTKPPGPGHFKVIVYTMDPLLPLNVKPDYCRRPEWNSKLDWGRRSTSSKHDEEFRAFVLDGKKTLYDSYYQALDMDHSIINSRETLDYFLQLDVTEEKLDLLVTDVMSEREIEDYLQHCWRHNKARANDGGEASGGGGLACVACGRGDEELRVCPRCPATYHMACRKQWLIQLVHGKNPPRKVPYKEALLRSRLQAGVAGAAGGRAGGAARGGVVAARAPHLVLPCPACVWGPDHSERVWHMKVFPFTYSRLLLEGNEAPAMKHSKWL